MEEKRQNARIDKPLIMQYAQSTPEPLRWDSTTIKNISTDGILFNTNKIFGKNERLQLRFTIPADPFNRLEAVGEVVESVLHGHRTRIKFINLGEHEKKVIGDYVECLLRSNKK
ncbi:MAG: PilZ domain-containing protein [Candidatus Omnitrophota bacterium]|nr:PilZ domain-containing protein [Candidatus Omnitrophota bacterium]